jgi:predicted ATP-dependent endonuclease of OLD family
VVRKERDGRSSVKKVIETDDLRLLKNELGHSNTDLYGYNVVVFIEGESEVHAFPIVAKSIGYDFVKEGIDLLNVKGNGRVQVFDGRPRSL